jgi:hypothetical protein
LSPASVEGLRPLKPEISRLPAHIREVYKLEYFKSSIEVQSFKTSAESDLTEDRILKEVRMRGCGYCFFHISGLHET